MKQAVEVFEEFIRQSSSTPNTRKHQPVEFGEVFIGNQSLPGLNLIEELKGKRIVRITGGVKQTYVFEESSDIENTITALHSGEDDRIQVDEQATATIEEAITYLEGNKIVDISAGKSHVMALTQEGEIFSYGYGQHGVLGHGGCSFEERPRFIRKLENRVIIQIACGMFHTLALSEFGDVYAWGRGFEGQLGIRKELECCSSPLLIGGFYKYEQGEIGYLKKVIVKQIACGSYHSMAIDDQSKLYCWGEARFGQTGNGRKIKESLPVHILIDNKPVVKVAGGYGHTLCLTQDGLIYSWGLNIKGQLGINDISENIKAIHMDNDLKNIKAVHHPTLLRTDIAKKPLLRFRDIACGFNSSFAIDVSGGAWGWGGDTNGFRDEGHCERAPRRITEGTEERNFTKLFSNEDMVVFFAPVRTLSFNPRIGPSKGTTEITFFGTGFSETGFQKVKFQCQQQEIILDADFDPASGTYFCKSPNFEETISQFPCTANVWVSLDGFEFYPFQEQFIIYSSTLTAESIEPKSASTKGGQELTLSIHLPELVSAHMPSITVGFKLSNKDQPQAEQKPSWTCVEGIYSEGEIKCKIPKIPKFSSNTPWYHVDISINGQQFSGMPNSIRFYNLTNVDINPKEGFEEGNYLVSITGEGLFDSSRRKVQLAVVFTDKTKEWPQLWREVGLINWDKAEKKYSFNMPPLTWLLGDNQPSSELVTAVKEGTIEVRLTLSGLEWIHVGNLKFVDPPPPPPEPEEEKDTKKGAKKAPKK